MFASSCCLFAHRCSAEGRGEHVQPAHACGFRWWLGPFLQNLSRGLEAFSRCLDNVDDELLDVTIEDLAGRSCERAQVQLHGGFMCAPDQVLHPFGGWLNEIAFGGNLEDRGSPAAVELFAALGVCGVEG